MMISVTDPHLRVSLLMHLIERLDRGELSELLESGACPQMMDKLRQLETGSLLRLGIMHQPEIHFSLNETGLDLSLEAIERHNKEIAELVYFVQNGASLSMLNQLFPTHSTEIIQTYRKLLSNERKAGRASLPDEKTRDAIHKLWHELANEGNGLREQLRVLHLVFPESRIDVLYATVNEFEEVAPSNKRSNP